MKKIIGFALAMLTCAILDAQIFTDRNLSPQQRAEDLVKRLTLEEKVSLMMHESPAIERLGIKAYNWWNEALHGVARAGSATVFPMPIGMAASFDEKLLEDVFTAVSDEARVKNRIARSKDDYSIYSGLTFWTPNINIVRDPRWGRGIETYGEDPFLTSRMGMAVVRGLQGTPIDGYDKAHACAKHFAVHSGPEPERHRFNAEVSDRDLHETYLPAFEELITRGGVKEVMFAYNRFRGFPCGASTLLLQDILRDRWRFDGVILSDCWAVDDFFKKGRHEWAEDGVKAVAAAVNAGAELECGSAFGRLVTAVNQGLVNESTIDKAVTRLLRDRFALGEVIPEPVPFDSIPESVLCSDEHRALALKMARETMVLLKNDGILPLQSLDRVALVGPNCADSTMMWGNYNGLPLRTITLLDAFSAESSEPKYTKGCEIALDTLTLERKAALLSELQDVDIVVFGGGISPRYEGESLKCDVPGFKGGDRTSIELPAVQRELIQFLKENGKKVILVNFSGSAMGLVPESHNCSAILQAWYPGQEGGHAIMDILTGRFNPCGKLPVTFYANVDQLPPFEDYSMKGRTYRFFEGKPLYPFGYGLSYTKFKMGKPKFKYDEEGDGEVLVRVRNVGKVAGTEVVKLYMTNPEDSDGPIKTLRGFARVTLKPGESKVVSIPLETESWYWFEPDIGIMSPDLTLIPFITLD